MRVMARPAARNTIKPMKAHLKRYVRGAGWADNGIRVKSGNRNIMDDLKDGRKLNKKGSRELRTRCCRCGSTCCERKWSSRRKSG